MLSARRNNQLIRYEDTGGDGPVLVFSHGSLMDHTMFTAQVAALRGKYRCILWDGQGHGGTANNGRWMFSRPRVWRFLFRLAAGAIRKAPPPVPLPTPPRPITGQKRTQPVASVSERMLKSVASFFMLDPLSVYDSSDDCIAVMDAAGVDRAVLIGMSVGGFLSLRCALDYPERVRALVLLSTQAGLDGPEVAEKQQPILMDWLCHGLSPEGIAVIEETLLGTGFKGVDLWAKKWMEMHPAHALRCSLALATRDDISESAAEIRVPVLVVHGENDMAIPLGKAVDMHRRFSNAAPLVTIPGAGHGANLTHPHDVNEAIASFLETIPCL